LFGDAREGSIVAQEDVAESRIGHLANAPSRATRNPSSAWGKERRTGKLVMRNIEREATMSLTTAVLFLHILGSMGFAASLAVEWLVAMQLKRSSHFAQVAQLAKVSKGLPAIGVPSLVLTLATGIVLAAIHGSWARPWIVVALVSLGLLVVTGASLTAPASLALQKRVEAAAGREDVSIELRGAINNITLAVALRLKTMLFVSLVYLMTGRPGIAGAVAATAAALVLGATWAYLGRRPASP
jgi:hypothetical protein